MDVSGTADKSRVVSASVVSPTAAATAKPRAEMPSAANPCQSQPRARSGPGPALACGYPLRSVCCSPDSSLIPHLPALPCDRAVTRSGIQEVVEACLDGAPTACLILFRLVTGPPKQARQLEKDNK